MEWSMLHIERNLKKGLGLRLKVIAFCFCPCNRHRRRSRAAASQWCHCHSDDKDGLRFNKKAALLAMAEFFIANPDGGESPLHKSLGWGMRFQISQRSMGAMVRPWWEGLLLLIATPSAFADVNQANMFQDLRYIKATCIYNHFNKVDKKTARMMLKTVYENHKSNQEQVTLMFQQSLDAYPDCPTLFPEEIEPRMQTKATKIPCQFNDGKWIQVES